MLSDTNIYLLLFSLLLWGIIAKFGDPFEFFVLHCIFTLSRRCKCLLKFVYGYLKLTIFLKYFLVDRYQLMEQMCLFHVYYNVKIVNHLFYSLVKQVLL